MSSKGMSKEQFLHAFERSPEKWSDCADTLEKAAELVQLESAEFNKLYFEHAKKQQRDDAWISENRANSIGMEMAYVGAMLRAMSIETRIKGLIYQIEIKNNGHVRNVDAIGYKHDLVELLAEYGVDCDDDEKKTLQDLKDMVQLGRYPILREKKPRRIRVSKNSQPDRDSALRDALILRLESLLN